MKASDLRVIVVGPVNTDCGISEYGRMLGESLRAQGITVYDTSAQPEQGLDPMAYGTGTLNVLNVLPLGVRPLVVHLNYHAALLSRWHPEHIVQLQHDFGVKVALTYHDTVTRDNGPQLRALAAVADLVFVHEPVEDVANAIVIPQPVPDLDGPVRQFDFGRSTVRPRVGTMGFALPWKNYELLCDACAISGWQPVILAAGATPEQVADWTRRCPWGMYRSSFLPREEVRAALSACDATAFLYTCHNAGTSGAVCQGLATGKPILLMRGCRQFHVYEALAHSVPHWVEFDAHAVATALSRLTQGLDMGVVALAHAWSWSSAAARIVERYHGLFHGLFP